MAPRPIFTATHPRACSTAFERVFMTLRNTMDSYHEPFGDPWYYGPERLSERFEKDPATREATGMSNTTYKDVFDSFQESENQGKRVFIKDMAQYIFAPDSRPTTIAPSFGGVPEPGNPTVLPLEVLRQFHWTFLIRHPRRSVPSYWRCSVPPRKDVTGWEYYDPGEAGYVELVKLLDYLDEEGLVSKDNVTVVDADDVLDDPEGIIRAYCKRTGIEFSPSMLQWNEADDKHAEVLFEKWNGWHDDALKTSCLQKRTHRQKSVTEETENEEWVEKYGEEAQKIIRKTVDENIPHYEYLKQFRIKAAQA